MHPQLGSLLAVAVVVGIGCGASREEVTRPSRPLASGAASAGSATPGPSVAAVATATAATSDPPATEASPKPKVFPPADLAAIHFGVAPPERFVLDGAIGEWTDAACSAPPSVSYDAPAPSCVVVAIDSKQITVAARVAGGGDGIWFRIADPAENTIPIPTAVVDAGYLECPLNDSRCAVTLDLKRKVGRTYHLTTKAIAAGADGTSARTVAAAKVVSAKGEGGVITIEATLPVSELPWFACQSTITWAVAAFQPKFEDDSRWMQSTRDGWERVDAYADFRSQVGWRGNSGQLALFRLGSTTTTMCSTAASTVSCTDAPTLQSEVSNDMMRVGILPIWKNDDLRYAAVVRLPGSTRLDEEYESEPLAVVKRGVEIDVMRFDRQCPPGAMCLGVMSISRVMPDGAMTLAPHDGDDPRVWSSVSAYHDASWKEFGLRGTAPENPRQAVDLHFTYDDATSTYHSKLIK